MTRKRAAERTNELPSLHLVECSGSKQPQLKILKGKMESEGLICVPLKKVFFDIDDTLFPSTEFAKRARRDALNAAIGMGLRIPYVMLEAELEKVITQFGSNYANHFDVLFDRLDVNEGMRDRVVAAAIGAYHDAKNAIQAYPDVPCALRDLRDRGYGIYAASDGIAVKQWDKLIRMHIPFFFDDVFVSGLPRTGQNSGGLGVEKSAEFYSKIIKLAGMKADECVMIGDREDKDIAPAKEAGFRTVRVRRASGKYAEGETAADADVSSFENLASVLESI